MLAVGRPHADQLAVRHALTRFAGAAHDAHALGTFVLDVPFLDHEALGIAVVVFLARAHPAKRGDLLLLLRRQLGLRRRRLEYAAGDVIVDAGELVARLRQALPHPPLARPGRLRLAPLAIEIDQQLLARRLHAVFAER